MTSETIDLATRPLTGHRTTADRSVVTQAARPAVSAGCCSTDVQNACCSPQEKESCCGAAGETGTCGCRS